MQYGAYVCDYVYTECDIRPAYIAITSKHCVMRNNGSFCDNVCRYTSPELENIPEYTSSFHQN